MATFEDKRKVRVKDFKVNLPKSNSILALRSLKGGTNYKRINVVLHGNNGVLCQ